MITAGAHTFPFAVAPVLNLCWMEALKACAIPTTEHLDLGKTIPEYSAEPNWQEKQTERALVQKQFSWVASSYPTDVWASPCSCYSPPSTRAESMSATLSLLWEGVVAFTCQTPVNILARVALLTCQMVKLNSQDPACARKEGNWWSVGLTKAGRETTCTTQWGFRPPNEQTN